MLKAEASGWIVQNPSRTMMRALRLAAIVFGIGLVMSANAARAQDDDEDDSTFEEKIIKQIMTGIGGTNMENTGIEYRERSPLVIPPRNDLPPPAAAAATPAPNWPKDPDIQKRKAAIAARKKENKDPIEAARILKPSELAVGTTAPVKRTAETNQPGDPGANAILSPSQLGYEGGLSGLFGGSKTESAPFKGEPTRETLTMPPPGYQTPSPNFAYGTGGVRESLVNKEYNPSQGKYGE
jgi:hypothetical protein